MRKILFLTMTVLVFALAGCGTKTVYIANPSSESVEPNAHFSVGEVKDSSGFMFEADDDDAFDLKDAMRSSLQDKLTATNPIGDSSRYIVAVDILDYAPGNAALRWLAPGAGETKLSVEAEIKAEDGKSLATIQTARSIAFGGGFTIGAWKYVFDTVAEEIVEVIRNPEKRKTP